ncbi:MAG: nuclear transport factor 2 family protein [Gemmatimonadetes bacterium]|nr:nuclear transport factor 2 family protein [Gemmatimonadota bacterium]
MNARISLLSATIAYTFVLFGGLPDLSAQVPDSIPERQVMEAERAFAKTMADRDARAFAEFVSDEAVFYGSEIFRGRRQVVDGWSRYFQPSKAPFSWSPEHVEVLPSGTLALSSGPVYDPTGKRIGTFNSVWRLEADGRWRVVFDKGCSCGS